MIEEKVIELIRCAKPLGKMPVTLNLATDETINKFESIHQFKLPMEVKTWFRRCDGANVNPGGLYSLFSKETDGCSIDWYFKEYPEWKDNGWIPIANDGCGDFYILTTAILIDSTKTHPVFFLDQADISKPAYAVASGLWKFLFFLLQNEALGKESYWPFNKEKVLAIDPALKKCHKIPLPWDLEE